MSELSDVVRGVLEFSAGEGDQLEAYAVHRVSTTIQADTNAAVRHVSVAETRGLGVRVIRDHRLGYASTSDLERSTVKLTVERARANASASDSDAAQALADPQPALGPPAALISPELESASLREKVALVVDLAQDVVARDRRVPAIDTAEYHDEIKSVAVASTRGVDIEQKIGFLEIWSDALGEDTGVKAAEDAYQVGRSLADIRVDRLAAEAVQRTVDLLASEVSCPSELPIVFDPLVVADFLNAIGKGLSGGAMSSGRSPFASQQGMSVAPPWLELVDDGISPLFRTAAVYDDEGLPRRRTSLVKAGVLSGVMHSTVTARAMSNGASTTGNARRGSYKTVPKASPHCLVLTPTATRDAVIASAGRALYIQQLAGAGAGIDPITGRVEVGGVGWLLDDGQNVGRLPVVPISTTLPTFLRSITAVGDDTYQAASLPTAGCTVMCGSELLRGVGLN